MGLCAIRAAVRRLAFLLVGFALSGCVLPFVSPPVRVTQAFGLASGTLLPSRTSRHERVAELEPVTSTRIGVHPMQLIPSLLERRLDVGLGYAFETFTADQLIGRFDKHAIYAELSAFPFRTMIDRRVGTRVGVTATGDVLFGNAGLGVEVGAGGSLALTLEIFGFGRGGFVDAELDPDDGVGSIGGVWGEWSVAMSAYAAYRALDGASYGQLGLAISVRLPASAGVLMFLPKRSRSRIHREGSEWREGTVDVNSSSSSDDDYHAEETTPSDGGIGSESGSGTVDVNPPPERGTVDVNPPPERGTVDVNPP